MSVLTKTLRATLIFALQQYRTKLSPKKGFRCAHNAAFGQGSCSEFSCEMIEAHSLVEGVAKTLSRLRECKKAATMLAVSSEEQVASESSNQEDKQKVGDCSVIIASCWPF